MATVRVVGRLREEFGAMPGLRLTEAQVRRLCSADAATSASALRALVSAGFLRPLENGAYARTDPVSMSNEVVTAMSRANASHSPWRRILALLEFEGAMGASLSPASHSALHYATTLAVTHRARVTALHVVPHSAEKPPGFPTQVTDPLTERRRAEAVRGLIDVNVAVGMAHDELMRTAAEIEADLIVVGREDHTRMVPLSRLREVLREAPCPVLIVSPAGHAAVA